MKTTLKISIYTCILGFLLIKSCEIIGCKVCEHRYTREISKNLYEETYQTYNGGVYGGELTDCYLTDSISFRTKVGSFDEHEFIIIEKKNDLIFVHNCEHYAIHDTIEKQTFTKEQLILKSNEQQNAKKAKPIFGENNLLCENGIDTSSWKTDKEINFIKIRYKCDNVYKDAIFFERKPKERVFIGLYEPGSLENNYDYSIDSIKQTTFYRVNEIRKIDTIKTTTFELSKLMKKGIKNVCK